MKCHTKCEYKFHPWAYVLLLRFHTNNFRQVPVVPVSHIAGIPLTCTDKAMSTWLLQITWRHIFAGLSSTNMLTSIVQYTFRVTDIQQTMPWRGRGSATRWLLCYYKACIRRARRLCVIRHRWYPGHSATAAATTGGRLRCSNHGRQLGHTVKYLI